MIIAILATIAFLTLWDYPMQARDARRLSDKNNIEKALEIYRAEKWEYPKFDEENWQKIFWTWVWEKVNTSLSTLPRDPLTNKLYKIEIKETPDKVKIAKVVLDGEIRFTNNKTQEKSNQLKTDPKAPDYVIPMEKWKCKEWYLEYNWKCRKIWEMKLVYDLDKDWLNVKVHFSYSWAKFSSIDWWDNWQNNCPTSWDGYSNCTYAKKWVYTVRVKWYADNLWYLSRVENNWNKRIIEISDWNDLWVTSLDWAFYQAENFNYPVWYFDTSRITSMKGVFREASKFNQPLNNWNTSNVRDMNSMFNLAKNFNQPINNWDVSNVTNMSYMFQMAFSFNQPINNWDVSNVTNMLAMFSWTVFNQPINNWNVSKVKDMSYMFEKAFSFNQPINNWDVSNVTNMLAMFAYTEKFNQPLNNWNVSKVIDMGVMFYNWLEFNQDISDWNVDKVTNFESFYENSALSSENIPPKFRK